MTNPAEGRPFIVIGENIHTSRVVRRDGVRIGTGADGQPAVRVPLDGGGDGLLPVPEVIRETREFGAGRVKHVMTAVLEGVAFSMKDCFELLTGAGLSAVDQVRVAGGGARSSLWRRILASVLNVELVTVNSSEGASFGAALLAGVGAGAWADVDAACEATIAITGRDQPDSAWKATYDSAYLRYRSLYPALKPTFDGLASA